MPVRAEGENRMSVREYHRKLISTSIAVMTIVVLSSQIGAATVEEIATMKSAERQKLLIEGAKREGKVSWYTTLIVDQVVRPVKEAFEKEYPFIQVEFFRGNSERIVQKMLAEYQAKRYDVDIIDGTVSPTMVRRAGFLQRFYSPSMAEYPAELKDPQGFWGTTNLYFFALGYNTKMVKAAEVPKSYEDLLNPRWKWQMMWSTSRGSGAPIFIGTVLQAMGAEAGKAYLQKLKAHNIAKTTASNRQVLDLTIAGEYPLALQIFNHHAYISKQAGAPVLASAGARHRYNADDSVGQESAARACRDVVTGLCHVRKRATGFPAGELSSVTSEGSGQTGRFETRRRKIQTGQLYFTRCPV